ncbi:MAG: SIMPL domain-containing protein [Novosphingobium sp.]|nr:SIMPL domain-containing protein [Novosphingobium sp.]
MKSFAAFSALAAASLGATPVMAQDAGPAPGIARGHTLLSVNAEGKSTRTPDVAVFSAGVTSTGKTASEALAANSADMNRVMQALKRAGIADRDIQTSDLSLYPVYASNPPRQSDTLEEQAPRIIGYRANNTVSVKQRKLDQYGKVIDTLVTAGANQVNGPSFQMDDPEPALDEARTAAIGTARKRADLYARALGLKVARVLSVSESGGWSPPRPVAMYARAEAQGAPPISAGQVEANVTVSVQFELAP